MTSHLYNTFDGAVILQNCSVTGLPRNTTLLFAEKIDIVGGGGLGGLVGLLCFFKSVRCWGEKWDCGIILFIISQILTEGQFRAIPQQKWNFKSMLWIEKQGQHKYAPKFIAISNVLKFHLNGRSNNYLRAEVIGTLTELFVDSLLDVLRPGTVYQQSLEWACIFEDAYKAFIYLLSHTAEQYTADKYCQFWEKELILIVILVPKAGIRKIGKPL